MRIAFFAPLKPLDSPVPSGDRAVGRLIVRALEMAGHEVIQPSRLRLWLKEGSEEALREKERLAETEAERLLAEFHEHGAPELWLTYHLYHKAPDWLGTRIAESLGIPYVAIEASRAAKRRTGEWAYGFAAVDRMLERADMVVASHRLDARGLSAVVPEDRLTILPPFIDATPFAATVATPAKGEAPVRLLTVAMMRAGDKTASYRVLADALDKIRDLDWQLSVVGDGEMREEIMSWLDPERTGWLGQLDAAGVAAQYGQADLFVWPAVREAYGLVFLEAQASGLPVVAGDTNGVPDIVYVGETGFLAVSDDAESFAKAMRLALSDRDHLARMGAQARESVLGRHDIHAASQKLDAILRKAQDIHNKRLEGKCRRNPAS